MNTTPSNTLTSHQLANQLLTMPDLPIVGYQVGQGGNERQDELLFSAVLGDGDNADTVVLRFGDYE